MKISHSFFLLLSGLCSLTILGGFGFLLLSGGQIDKFGITYIVGGIIGLISSVIIYKALRSIIKHEVVGINLLSLGNILIAIVALCLFFTSGPGNLFQQQLSGIIMILALPLGGVSIFLSIIKLSKWLLEKK